MAKHSGFLILAKWDEAIDVHSKALKPAENGVLRFRSTLETDGVGVSIIKKRRDRDALPRT
ncbi:hypothetical protein BX666DRAFT_1983676, partial [Dichotomocladium elegans]